jgi:hypothetical protein
VTLPELAEALLEFAPVPKIAVTKDRKLVTAEHDVGTSRKIFGVHSEP